MTFTIRSASSLGTRTVAVIAALREELVPLCSRLKAKKIHSRNGQVYYCAEMKTKRIILVRAGMGSNNARKALLFLFRIRKPELVVNMGFAGALSEELGQGDITTVTETMLWPSCKKIILEKSASLVPGSTGGRVIHRVLGLTVRKLYFKKEMARLVFLGGKKAVIDLETYHYAKICRDMGVPLVVIRSITDRLSDEFLFGLDDISDSNGHIKPAMALKKAISKPVLIPHFWKLWRISSESANNLAELCTSLIRRF